MSAEILASVITGALSLIGVCLTVWAGSRRTQNNIAAQIDKTQAVQQAKLDELTREVREHNGFARRMPVVEEQIKVINHRLEDLEEAGR